MAEDDLSSRKEEQDEEIEVLKSIYFEDFSMISAHQPYKFSIVVKPEEGDEDAEQPVVALQFYLPKDYPASPPLMESYSKEGLSRKDCSELVKHLDTVKQEFVGECMIYDLVASASEWVVERIAARDSVDQPVEEVAELNRFMDMDDVMGGSSSSRSRSYGTPVTAVSFRKWHEAFLAEKKERGGRDLKLLWESKLPGKLTGRQIFEQREGAMLAKLTERMEGSEEDGEGVMIFDDDVFLQGD